MSGEQQSMFDLVEPQHVNRPDWLGLGMDNRRLFDALQDGWLRPPPGHSGTFLGANTHRCEPREARDSDGNRIPVQIKVDAAKLPDIGVVAFRDNHWQRMPLAEVCESDAAIFWPGPLPLFSIIDLSVSSEEHRVRLSSIGKRVSNIDVPAVSVGDIAMDTPAPSSLPPRIDAGIIIPKSYDAMRGAVCMALWAVPRIDPWLELLTETLSARPQRLSDAAKAVDASWWRFPPWMRSTDASPRGSQEHLWLAASTVFRSANCARARDTVDRIAALARQGAPKDAARIIEEWRTTTRSVLRAEAAIGHGEWREKPVGLAIQLVLSRPEPTSFKTWFEDDHVSLPPAVAWSAAVLCGLLSGYRGLDIRFRGKESQREVVAVQSLRMSSHGTSISWPGVSKDPLKWRKETGNFILSWGGREFACKQELERGKWYAADLGNEVVQRRALNMVNEKGWPCCQRVISLGEGVRSVSGAGHLESGDQTVRVRGRIRVELLRNDRVEEVLDAEEFRRLIAVEPGRFDTPPEAEHDVDAPERSICVPGLRLIHDFITEAEETEVIKEIDQSVWSDELQRRVQHYGWRYDYRSRLIDPSMHIGPLPDWAMKIARRLVDNGCFRDGLPDQVIVNEYCGNQGIAPHVDSPASFTGVVAMVSLLESWEMEFRKRRENTKVVQRLERRSATILEGEARYKWTHEIRKRKTEPGPVIPGNKKPSRVPRDRRVSLTFRKVIDAAQDRPRKEPVVHG